MPKITLETLVIYGLSLEKIRFIFIYPSLILYPLLLSSFSSCNILICCCKKAFFWYKVPNVLYEYKVQSHYGNLAACFLGSSNDWPNSRLTCCGMLRLNCQQLCQQSVYCACVAPLLTVIWLSNCCSKEYLLYSGN